ncbi:MAG: helix-turn-helix transcriptional regulator [Hamadaea sp.]|nr:helix-turn-helix transcriptional regulator [Hamadaea sp.]
MRITDPRAIRALAHPLRLDLLELLGATGPATAAQCGRVLGVPQANCSFHLRQLAKYGFVEEAAAGHDQRERRWRVPAGDKRIRIPEEANPVVSRQLARVVVERETQAILAHVDDGPQSGRHLANAIAVMSTEEAADLWQAWMALLQPFVTRAESPDLEPGQRRFRWFTAATPFDLDPKDDNDTDR